MPARLNCGWGTPRSYLHSNRPNAIKSWQRTAGAPFRMPSSLHPSYTSRKPRCSLRRKTSIRRCGRSRLKAQRLSAEAGLAQAKAQLNQAQVNLERTRILAPVDGYVTNLLAQLGDYVKVGINTISLVDADSFWVDGYFEETNNLAPIRVGDPAQIKLMGRNQIVRGHVDSIARAIVVANAQPNNQGVATVNPIFTWVRLAQRIPVRVHIDEVPPGVILAAGMTATVEINDRGRSSAK
jgi:multidrug resistance efflux pump